MKTSVVTQALLALLAAAPAYVAAGPISADPANYSKLSKRGMWDTCMNVPHFYNDVGFRDCWAGVRDKKSYKVKPGTAKDCLDLANQIEEKNSDNWTLGNRDNWQVAELRTCNFNVRRVEDLYHAQVGGRDVVDVLRDSVKAWCGNSWEIRDGKMVAKQDRVSENCEMLGHGQMNACSSWGNLHRGPVSFAIGQKAASQGSFENDGMIKGMYETSPPDCLNRG